MSKICGILGLAYRANKILLGDKLIESIKQNKVFLVIIAMDIGSTNKKKIVEKCNYYQVKYLELFTKEELSKAIGKINISNLGITDKGFVKLIFENMEVA